MRRLPVGSLCDSSRVAITYPRSFQVSLGYEEERPEYAGRRPDPVFLTENGTGFTSNGFGTWLDRIGADIEEATGLKWSSDLMWLTWKARRESPLMDADLRASCMTILNGESNYDQAVMAACRILETRVREVSRAPESEKSGVRLMRFAFGPSGPPSPFR